jgi:hypothetical protein
MWISGYPLNFDKGLPRAVPRKSMLGARPLGVKSEINPELVEGVGIEP